ncbi:MAG: cytochrome c biogenesis protein/redoxin [Terrisporobacter sp.]|uniref:cytochrome c biogenesis protein/redoxin n=1 Tax=Terrisporobacter sp. TaxID=1965305 RepID=UPI002FCCA3A8
MGQLNVLVVFIEGLLSFLSPCVLPILPIYLSILSNSSTENLKSGKFTHSILFKNTIFFILGISSTFFILGSSVNALASFFSSNKDLIMIIGGIIIIFMGLFYMGVIKSSLLNREKRFNIENKEMKPITAFILGFTFSFGWTPCIGPILSSVLIMASSKDSLVSANLLIFVYTLGFVIPFIITSLFYNKLFKTIDKIKNHMDLIKKIGGTILIISGIVMSYNGIQNKIEYLNIQNKSKVESKINEANEKEEAKEDEKIKALDFTLLDQNNKEHKLSDYKGKTIFLNFWATWCPPCKVEMPDIEALYKEYGENKNDVVILGIASPNLGNEGDLDDVINFLKEEKCTFPVVMDDGGLQVYQYGLSSFPSTLIIDKDGYIQEYVPGAMNKDTMKSLIENHR